MNKPYLDTLLPPGLGPHYRATFSLPVKLAKDISRLAKRMGISQSAMLVELLTVPITAMCAVINEIPDTGATADDIKRARGKSLSLIRDAVQQAQSLAFDVADDRHR